MSNLKMRYIDFLEEQRLRDERNHRIIEALNKVDNSLANMTAKTNRLAILRKQYEIHLLRSYSTRTNDGKSSRAGSKTGRRNTSNIQTNNATQTVNSFAAQTTSNFSPPNQRYVKQESEVHSESRTPYYLHQSRPMPRDSQRSEPSVSDPRSTMGLLSFGTRNPDLSASTNLGNFYTGPNSVQSYDISATNYRRPSVMGLDDRSIRPSWLDTMSEQSSNSRGNYLEASTPANYTRIPLERVPSIATNDRLVGGESYDQEGLKLFPRLEETSYVTPDDFTAIELDRCINRIRGLFSKTIHSKDIQRNILASNSSPFLTEQLKIPNHTDPATDKLERYSYGKSTELSSAVADLTSKAENATALANSKLDHQNSTVSSIPSSSVCTNEIYHDIAGDEVHLVPEDPILDKDVDSAPTITRYEENNAKEIIRSREPTDQKISAEHIKAENEQTEVKAINSPVKNSDESISILRNVSSEKSVDDEHIADRIASDSRGSGDHVPESRQSRRDEKSESSMQLEQNMTKLSEELASKTNEYSLNEKSDSEPDKQYETSEPRQMYGKETDEPSINKGIRDYRNDQRYEIDSTRSRNLDLGGLHELNPREKYIEHSNDEHQTQHDGQSNANEKERLDGTLKELAEGHPYAEYVTDPNQQYEADPNQLYEAHPNQQYEAHPNELYEPGPNEQYEAHPNEQYEAHPNQQYEAHPNELYEPGPNEQYETHPNEQFEAHPSEQFEAHPNQLYEPGPNEQYETHPNEQYEAHPNELYEAHSNEQYETRPNEQYEAHPNEQYQVNSNEQYEISPNEQYEVNPNEQYETYSNEHYEAHPNAQYVANPEVLHGSNPNEDYVVDPAEQHEFGSNQPYDGTEHNEYGTYPNGQQYYGARDPQASSQNVLDSEYEYYSNEQYVQDPNNQQYEENPNASYIQEPHDYQAEKYGQNESYDGQARERYDENAAHPEELNSNYPAEYARQSFDHGQDLTGQNYGTVDHGVFGDNLEQVEDHSISESIPNDAYNTMGGTDKKTKDAINALLDSGTESTIEKDQSNTTENDFDFN